MFTKIKFMLILLIRFAIASDLRIREDSKVYIRLNIKLNSFEHTKIFAYAIGFRVNFDLRKSKKSRASSDFSTGQLDSYFHHEDICKATKLLFNLYGWNGTACITRTMCEVHQIPEYSADVFGPLMKLLFFGTSHPNKMTDEFCQAAIHCPISIFQFLFPEDLPTSHSTMT